MKTFQKLSKNEMKLVLGGVQELSVAPVAGSGTCCGHTADGQYEQCGVSKAEAQTWEMWCCASC